MPWRVKAGDAECPFEVVRSDTGKRVACHPSRAKAEAHVRALYANTEDEMEHRAGDGEDHKSKYGDVKYADPKNHKYPIDTEAHCRAAWSYINMPKNQKGYTSEEVAAIKGRIKAAAKKFGIEISEDSSEKRDDEVVWADIETRDAAVGEVNFRHRIITLVAMPYESPTTVPFRGDMWSEVFSRGAFDGILHSRPTRIRANREHDRNRTFGKVVKFLPDRDDALVAEVRAAQTPLGDETLALADEDCLSASVGFGVLAGGQVLDQFARSRRINAAHLDHLALVESPAYAGADVLSVRAGSRRRELDAGFPELDSKIAELRAIMSWTTQRLNRLSS